MPGTLCQAVDRSALPIRARSFRALRWLGARAVQRIVASFECSPRVDTAREHPVYFMEIFMSASQPAHNARNGNRMKNCSASENRTMRRICPSRAPRLSPWLSRSHWHHPPTPRSHDHTAPVPPTFRCHREHGISRRYAVGTRTTSAALRHWLQIRPLHAQATLFNNADKEVITTTSAQPVEGGTIRATWQHSRDASTVWAKVQGLRPRTRWVIHPPTQFCRAGALPGSS